MSKHYVQLQIEMFRDKCVFAIVVMKQHSAFDKEQHQLQSCIHYSKIDAALVCFHGEMWNKFSAVKK